MTAARRDDAVLYECDYESRVNGDCVIHVHVESLAYECPNRGAVVDSRREQDVLAAGSDVSLRFAGEE